MRRYADPVEVRQGPFDDDAQALGAQGATEGPQQFLWRGRLWKVRAVLAHWVETGPWWQSAHAQAVIGSADDDADGATTERQPRPIGDLLTERELWRVEAARGAVYVDSPGAGPGSEPDGGGVFDLCFDWAEGQWQLVGCVD